VLTPRTVRTLTLIGCPLIAVFGAALVTDFPFVDPLYAYETRWVLFSAITAEFASGLVIGCLFRSTPMRTNYHLLVHTGTLFCVLIANHIIWVQPIWGFHHDYSLGIFIWLFIGGEDGFSISPNIVSVFLTTLSFGILYCFATRLMKTLIEKLEVVRK